SRRRHTRWPRDWSSDVCSSDLFGDDEELAVSRITSDTSKSLSFREKRMLDRAKFLIISEVSEVMRETAAAIEGRVDRALERCFRSEERRVGKECRASGSQDDVQ